MSTVEVIETAGDYRVRLKVDQYSGSVNPREDYDHITFALTLPDSHYADIAEPGPLVNEWDRIKHRSDAVDLFTRYARTFHGAVVEYHTPERGPNSLWYMLPEQIAEIGGTPEEALRSDIQEYQNWADGEVFGYIIEKRKSWTYDDDPSEKMETWEEEESCWGLIGIEWARQAAKEAFDFYKPKAETSAV